MVCKHDIEKVHVMTVLIPKRDVTFLLVDARGTELLQGFCCHFSALDVLAEVRHGVLNCSVFVVRPAPRNRTADRVLYFLKDPLRLRAFV